jgi:cell division protein FtsI/penicillin-binding protein 2
VYPNGSLAAHVLGFVNTDELSVDGQSVLETSGQDGVELSLNSALSGVPGWR